MKALLFHLRGDETWDMTFTEELPWVWMRLPSTDPFMKSQPHLATFLFMNCFLQVLTRFFLTNHLHVIHHLRAAFWGTQLRYTVVGYVRLKMYENSNLLWAKPEPHLSLPLTISVRNASFLQLLRHKPWEPFLIIPFLFNTWLTFVLYFIVYKTLLCLNVIWFSK